MVPPINTYSFVPDAAEDPLVEDLKHSIRGRDPSDFFSRVEEGELDGLTKEQLTVVLRLAESQFILHTNAKHKCFYEAIRILLRKGLDPNNLDAQGRSALYYVTDLKFYRELKSKGAVFIHPEISELHYLTFYVEQEEGPELIAALPLEQYINLGTEKRLSLLQKSADKKYEKLSKVVDGIITRLQASSHQNIVTFLVIDRMNGSDISAINCIMRIINKGILTGLTIETLMTTPCYLKRLSNPSVKIEVFRKHGPYSVQLHALFARQEGLHMAMWCWALLKCNDVKQAAEVLKCLGALIYNRKCFDPKLRELCLVHLKKLDNEQTEKVLQVLEYSRIGFTNLTALFHLGLEVRNLTFTFFVYDICDNYPIDKRNDGWYDLKQTDKNGYNALEYWTTQDFLKHFDPKERFDIWRKLFRGLVELGLRLTPAHQFYDYCREAFPNHSYYQALLAHYLSFEFELETSYEKSAIDKAVKKMRDPYKPLPYFI